MTITALITYRVCQWLMVPHESMIHQLYKQINLIFLSSSSSLPPSSLTPSLLTWCATVHIGIHDGCCQSCGALSMCQLTCVRGGRGGGGEGGRGGEGGGGGGGGRGARSIKWSDRSCSVCEEKKENLLI